jgi:hypothetical protein
MKHSSRFAALLLLGFVTPALAQAALLGPGAAFISMGSASIATSELDDRLQANGYPTFGQKAHTAGVGGYRILSKRWVLGAELTGLFTGEKPHQGREVGIGGGYGTLGLGYMKQISPRVRIYPRIGLGAGGLTLWIETADTTTFDAVLANPQPVNGRQRLLSRDGGVVDFGLGAEFLPKGGWLLGVRAGYLAADFGDDSNWWMENGTATGGPKASIAGPYVRFVLGGAWKR